MLANSVREKNYWFPTKVSIDSAHTLCFSNVLTGRGEKGLDLNNIFIWEKLGLSTLPFTPQHPITCCSWGLTSDFLLFPTNNKKVFFWVGGERMGGGGPLQLWSDFFVGLEAKERPNHTKEAPRQSIIYIFCAQPTVMDVLFAAVLYRNNGTKAV